MSALSSLEMIERFISFDTVSSKSNLSLIEFASSYLHSFGAQIRKIENPKNLKANLIASLGPVDRPGIILSGHSDVVPVDNQSWSTDPFRLTQRNEKLFGRGTSDMKSFLAIACALAPTISIAKLHTPIHIVMSYDEEVGCLGVHSIISEFLRLHGRAQMCIVGEPSAMKVVHAHKGTIGARFSLKGRPAHTGVAHLGANAIAVMGHLLQQIDHLRQQFIRNGPYSPEFEMPNYTIVEPTHVKGGSAINIVPESCWLEADIRYLPGEDPGMIIQQIRNQTSSFAAERGVEIDIDEIPGCAAFNAGPNGRAVAVAKILAREDKSISVGWGTEAGHFQNAGIDTVVCGPGRIEQAHQPNEYIELDQVVRCEQFLQRLIDTLSS